MTDYKLVPVEPTPEMIDAGRSQSSFPLGVYKAMIAAAPAVQGEPVGIVGRRVSLDVSTGDHNACHRLFGVVTGVEGRDGTILCELTEDNKDFESRPDVAQLVEALSKALEGVAIPSGLTPNQTEIFKAGARSATYQLNEILALYRKGGGA